jgi:hypothetical protein
MPSGDRVYASDGQRIVARGRRTTPTGSITTTETGVLRVDNIPVFAGKGYRILTSNINLDTSVANDIADARIRVAQAATTGTAATISSTQIGHMRCTIDDAAQSNVLPASVYYWPSSDGYLSVLLSAQRITGTGNIVVFCSSVELLDLVIEELGTDPGDTGVVI